jgi:hypothetical protein
MIKHGKTFTDVLEYVAVAIAALLVSVFLSGELPMPLWGGLSDLHFR